MTVVVLFGHKICCFYVKFVVVFVEVFEFPLPYKQRGALKCTVKAPTNSSITMWQKGQAIIKQFSVDKFSVTCDDSAQISISSQKLDDQFSMFYAVIHVS